MNEMGGTNAPLKGNLKRRLVTTTIAAISPGENPGGTKTVSAVLRGLSKVLDVAVGVGAFTVDAQGNTRPLFAAAWPAGAGTIQITPQGNFPDRGKVPFRPIFQDPTFVDNLNHPLPQALPFSWNFPGEADEAVIDIVLNIAPWAASGTVGEIVLEIWVEYFGPWWDIDAVMVALGQVNCSVPGSPAVIAS
jgi:hypothetical protein